LVGRLLLTRLFLRALLRHGLLGRDRQAGARLSASGRADAGERHRDQPIAPRENRRAVFVLVVRHAPILPDARSRRRARLPPPLRRLSLFSMRPRNPRAEGLPPPLQRGEGWGGGVSKRP